MNTTPRPLLFFVTPVLLGPILACVVTLAWFLSRGGPVGTRPPPIQP